MTLLTKPCYIILLLQKHLQGLCLHQQILKLYVQDITNRGNKVNLNYCKMVNIVNIMVPQGIMTI